MPGKIASQASADTSRYGIYFCPRQESPLFALGSQWLGRDALTGKDIDPELTNGLGRDEWRRATGSPRRYGFHATLKPPFRLAQGAAFDQLRTSVHTFAARHASFKAPPLQVGTLGHFLALTLADASQEFSHLADACVTEFDNFRAPATEHEIALRVRDSMPQREREHVFRWGYPYVFDTWKFHMSLTGSLAAELLPYMERILKQRFASVCGQPFVVDSICIFHEPSPGSPFLLVDRAKLGSRL